MLDEAGELAGYEPIMDANADSQSLASDESQLPASQALDDDVEDDDDVEEEDEDDPTTKRQKTTGKAPGYAMDAGDVKLECVNIASRSWCSCCALRSGPAPTTSTKTSSRASRSRGEQAGMARGSALGRKTLKGRVKIRAIFRLWEV